LYKVYGENIDVTNHKSENFEIRSLPRIKEEELFQEIKNSNYYFAFYPANFKDFISTKIYEIVALQIPIILVSKKGYLSDFIVDNKLGVFYDIEDMSLLCDNLANSILITDFYPNYGIENYHIEAVIKDLLNEFERNLE
jgi:hypothetical protein